MIVAEDLQSKLLEEGWYLQCFEFLTIASTQYARGLVRFPCHGPMYFTYVNAEEASADSVIQGIKEKIWRTM